MRLVNFRHQEVRVLPRIVAPLLLALASLIAIPGTANADPYAPQVPTRTTITVKVGQAGEPVVLGLRVSANADEKPTGTLEVTLGAVGPAAGDAAPADWSTTVRHDGGTTLVEGPELVDGKTYVVTAAYTPDSATFLASDATERFTVGGDGGGDDGDDGDNDNDGGLLPDTGGPTVLWLVLGLVLVAGGAGVVVYARRKESSAVPTA